MLTLVALVTPSACRTGSKGASVGALFFIDFLLGLPQAIAIFMDNNMRTQYCWSCGLLWIFERLPCSDEPKYLETPCSNVSRIWSMAAETVDDS